MNVGRLVYVMGPSGVGKDSVLNGARPRLKDRGVVFAHRYITRPADAGGENHVALTEEEFADRLNRGCFALHWRSHGHAYGLGREIDIWMESGLTVVMNGSRGYLDEASRRYPDIVPVLITASSEVLAERLKCRGRECDEEIVRRLRRAEDFAVAREGVIRIENNGPLEQAVDSFVRLIDELRKETD